MRGYDEETLREMKYLAEFLDSLNIHADGEETARKMMESVGVLRSVYEQNRLELSLMDFLNRESVEAMSMLEGVKRAVELEEFPEHMSCKTFGEASAYLRTLMKGRNVEYCYLMCIGRTGRLIQCPLLQRGTVDQAAVYAREVALTALETRASYAVLSHNHPGGTTEPSPADLQITAEILLALRTVNVAMLDHIIVTDRTAVSIRALGKPSESLWIKGRENDKILVNWNKT